MQEVLIKIPDEAYSPGQKRAKQEGCNSIEVFLSDLLVSAMAHDLIGFDHLFTPEVIATIDAATIEARTGNNITMDEVKRNLKAKREAWLANHPV